MTKWLVKRCALFRARRVAVPNVNDMPSWPAFFAPASPFFFNLSFSGSKRSKGRIQGGFNGGGGRGGRGGRGGGDGGSGRGHSQGPGEGGRGRGLGGGGGRGGGRHPIGFAGQASSAVDVPAPVAAAAPVVRRAPPPEPEYSDEDY